MRLGIKLLLALTLLLSSCTTYDSPKILRSAFTLSITESDNLPPNTLGTAVYHPSLNACIITLRKYPQCLLHEIRHCIEGDWHGDLPNTEDC
jgi:hypothetical protein